MNWDPLAADRLQPLAERGRPGPRFVRGLLWALAAIFVISILAFWLGHSIAPPVFERF
jgi:hypothetical protein